jgi:hypothetical protein
MPELKIAQQIDLKKETATVVIYDFVPIKACLTRPKITEK